MNFEGAAAIISESSLMDSVFFENSDERSEPLDVLYGFR